MLSKAKPPAVAPGPWDFWTGTDVISVLLTACWKLLYLLCFVVTIGLAFIAMDRLYEHAVLVLCVMVCGILLLVLLSLLPVGNLVSWMHVRTLWWEGTYWPIAFVLACTIYLFVLVPYLPAMFALVSVGYLSLVKLNFLILERMTESQPRLVRIVKAIFRSAREYLLLTATGYGFVLMGQVLVLIWSGLHHDGIWVWERAVRKLTLLPELKWWFVVVVLLSLSILSLLNPKLEMVRRATATIKVYKQILAFAVVFISFTFFTSKIVAGLHHEYLLEHQPREVAPRSKQALQMVRRASYLRYRIDTSTVKEREALREELLRLDRESSLKERDAGVVSLRDALEAIQPEDVTDSNANNATHEDSQHTNGGCSADGAAVYSECREAIVKSLEELLGAYKPKTGNELLDSIAEVLLDSTYGPILDSVVPDELSSADAVERWLGEHVHHRALLISSPPPEPEWGAIIAAEGIVLPKIGVLPDEWFLEGSPSEGAGGKRIRVLRIEVVP